MAKISTKARDKMPASSFLYTDANGVGHLPFKDPQGNISASHIRNALARLNQTQIPSSVKPGIKAKAERLLAKLKKYTDNTNNAPVEKSIMNIGSAIKISFAKKEEPATREVSPEEFCFYALAQIQKASFESNEDGLARLKILKASIGVADARNRELQAALRSGTDMKSLPLQATVYQEPITRLKSQSYQTMDPSTATVMPMSNFQSPPTGPNLPGSVTAADPEKSVMVAVTPGQTNFTGTETFGTAHAPMQVSSVSTGSAAPVPADNFATVVPTQGDVRKSAEDTEKGPWKNVSGWGSEK